MSGSDPDVQAANQARAAEIQASLRAERVPAATRARLEAVRDGRLPWLATLTPAELLITRSHGLRPIAAVSATCWLHYGWSWTEGHSQGWHTALRRLRAEARAAGANAVLDVKMRTIALAVAHSMDFTLVGTAVRVEGLPPSDDPVVATVPALEFVKLLAADVVPTGLAIGAKYERIARMLSMGILAGTSESEALSELWDRLRKGAHAEFRNNAEAQGNGLLAHHHFSQLIELKNEDTRPCLGRYIVVATTIDARRGQPLPDAIGMAVDMHAGATPLAGRRAHHQSYASNEAEGAI